MANGQRALSAALRAGTREHHRRLEMSDMTRALADGALPLDSYAAYLRSMAVVHTSLERAADELLDPTIGAVWEPSLARGPALARDIAHLSERGPQVAIPRALEAALRAAEDIRVRARSDPASLVGDLYVLEGSTQGAPALRAGAARSFGLKDAGLAYLSPEPSPAERWARVKGRLDALKLPADAEARVIDAAVRTFGRVHGIVGAVFPLPAAAEPLPTALNPEAGRHPIPTDARELDAALRAGERSWDRFPYYEHRYGERGRRFTSSDSAWLATLANLEQPYVDRQIDWLGRVLAARGMPTWLLEVHLEHLYEELVKAVPERRSQYRRLVATAERLGHRRQNALDDGTFGRLARAFDEEAHANGGAHVPGAGEIILAAVADERAGVRNAVESLESWITDPERFPPGWNQRVHDTIRRARQLAG